MGFSELLPGIRDIGRRTMGEGWAGNRVPPPSESSLSLLLEYFTPIHH